MTLPKRGRPIIRDDEKAKKHRDYMRAYWAKNHAHILEQRRKKKMEEPERLEKDKERHRERRRKDPERVRQLQRENRQRNKERVAAWKLASNRRCRERVRSYQRYWELSNAPKIKAWDQKKRIQLRTEMIEAYGGACKCCGESEPEFLSIDHIYGNARSTDRMVGGKRITGTNLYRSLRKRGWPKDEYQLLCHNCNFAKGHHGQCPHARKRNVQKSDGVAV